MSGHSSACSHHAACQLLFKTGGPSRPVGSAIYPLPVGAETGSLQALACRIRLLSRMNRKDAGEIWYVHMLFGIRRMFCQSIADAFLLNTVGTRSGVTPRPFDRNALAAGPTEQEMPVVAFRLLTLPEDRWDVTVQEFPVRRAGYHRTMFSSAWRWRAALREAAGGKLAA